MRKKVYAAAGNTTIFSGPGRSEFNVKGPNRSFEEYLKETAKGTLSHLKTNAIDEGVIGSFMSARFINQANLPGFLPFMVKELEGKSCIGVEGACGTGGKAITTAVKSVLAECADAVFVAGFEMQNTLKPIYGADVLAGAAYYAGERKKGAAHLFPSIFSERAKAYFERYGEKNARIAMAKWYEQAILNARKNPKAQEFENKKADLFAVGMTPPNPYTFVSHLNHFDCSKVSDGAASLIIASIDGLSACGIPLKDAVEIVGIGESESDITQGPLDTSSLSNTANAVQKALQEAKITKDDLALLEVHDCFTITALLSLEAIGFAEKGKAAEFIIEGNTRAQGKIPTNLSGGLIGFGHPTGATGVRQLVDLLHQSIGVASNQVAMKSEFGMLISMGGNDKTVTSIVTKKGQ